MGFLSKIGKSISNIVKDSAKGIVNQAISSVKDGVVNGLISGVNKNHGASVSELYDSILANNDEDYLLGQDESVYSEEPGTLTSVYTVGSSDNSKLLSESNPASSRNKFDDFLRARSVWSDATIADPELKFSPSNDQVLYLPKYDYGQWINERTIWQKGLSDPFGDPGYFYFKIFFRFDTQHGLFGGVLNDKDPWNSHNGALKYLVYMTGDDSKWYKSLVPMERYFALIRFTKILSYINVNAPWFFRSVKGLGKAGTPITNEFSKEKSIEIECNTDAIDMRLTTLMDLYRFVCYDDFTGKEVLPDNLRKFDMMVMIFNTPIKTLHTAMKLGSNKYNYKGTYLDNIANTMSFKLFEFNGCEFDPSTIGSMIPDDMNNENPFQLGKGVLKINYDRCTQYTNNEFDRIMFGSTGMYYSYDDGINVRDKVSEKDTIRKKAYLQKYQNNTPKQYSGTDANEAKYVEASEALTKNNLTKLSGYAMGNLYHEELAPTLPHKYENGKNQSDYINEYEHLKNTALKNPQNQIAQMGLNTILQKYLKSSKDAKATLGYLDGYEEKGPGSEWWNEKMKRLTSNHDHLWTTPPHTASDHHSGIHGDSSHHNKSRYVQAQEFNQKMAGIDQFGSSLGISSYSLRDKASKSLKDIWTRSKSGEFVGPGSSTYANKVKAIKEGTHENTIAPHTHNYSDNEVVEKYVKDLKETSVNGQHKVLSQSSHQYTVPLYRGITRK